MQSDIFLSYAHEDELQARALFNALGRQGWNVFMDQEIPNMARWEQHLESQLDSVSCVLVLWSPAARTSEWVCREAQKGLDRQVLVQVTLDGNPPPEVFSSYQANHLRNWAERTDHPEFLRVLRAVAMKIGTQGGLGVLPEPAPYEKISEDHIALTSTSWRREGEAGRGPYPYQIHLRLVGTEAALRRIENVVYYFARAYALNRPDFVDPVLKAYAHVSADWRSGFRVMELANGYSVVRASVKVKDQSEIIKLSRLVDMMPQGPFLDKLYPISAQQRQPIPSTPPTCGENNRN